ncbi:MAG: peptidylprolyl isomerase, partial [Lysobacterales bacterium]
FTIAFVISIFSSSIHAQETDTNLEIFAERGKGVVTQDDFTARADRIPEHSRKATLRDRNRVNTLLQSMLIASQLAADAREAGFDKEKIVIDRMRLAADAELADAWLSHYVEVRSEADFEALAHEYYLLNGKSIRSSPRVDVSHILISTNERSDQEAKDLADTIYSKLMKDPSQFDQFVVEYSEDPSAPSNKGKFKNVKKGDMVENFEVTAFALQQDEISEPVKTNFGYHIIRLDAKFQPKQMTFEEVKDQLIARERAKHIERVKADYLDSLQSQEIRMSEAQLLEMVRRQFGEDYVDPNTTRDNSE